MRWGLIPFFTKSLKDVKVFATINARGETISTSPIWRVPFKKRRCLVPATAFYEWKTLDTKTKQRYAIGLTNADMFAFAGVWDAWKDEQANWL
jgi:putative SOS response-associated peptidase YedK